MDDGRLWSLRRKGNNYRQIAQLTGLSEDDVRERMRVRRAGADADPNEHLIQLELSAIRMKWSEQERISRLMVPDHRVFYDSLVSLDVPRPSRN